MGRTREVLPNWKRWGWSLSGILCLPTKPLDAALLHEDPAGVRRFGLHFS